MKILVTGANGFVGRNLIAELNNRGYEDIYKFDIDTEKTLLSSAIRFLPTNPLAPVTSIFIVFSTPF